jgi:hypothetical protein
MSMTKAQIRDPEDDGQGASPDWHHNINAWGCLADDVVMGTDIARGLHGVTTGAGGGGTTMARTIGANSLVPQHAIGPASHSDVKMKDGSASAPCHRRAGITCVLVLLCLLWPTSNFHYCLLLSGRRRDSFLIRCCTPVPSWARKDCR